MRGMFWGAESFEADISTWRTGQVTDMSLMFFFSVSALSVLIFLVIVGRHVQDDICSALRLTMFMRRHDANFPTFLT
jgi:surface protein